MRRIVLVVVAVLAGLLVIGVVADRAAAAVAERTISAKVEESMPAGSGAVTTSIVGVPILTQLARGSLDHVTVTATDVQSGKGLTLASAVVDLFDVSISAPYVARHVEAAADITTAELQKALGESWTVRPDGAALAVRSTGGLELEARVLPSVKDGRLALTLGSVTVLGVSVDGSVVPSVVRDRIDQVAASVGDLPLGLTPTSVTVTPTGVRVTASGTDVDLEQG